MWSGPAGAWPSSTACCWCPGACFGDRYRDYVRLGFGGTTAELTAGLDRLERVLREDTGMG